MKIFYSLLLVTMLFSTSLFAQKQGISLGGNVHFPVGDWADFASTVMEVLLLMNIQ